MSQAATAIDLKYAVTVRGECRLCSSTGLIPVWSFGPTPLANSYLKPEELGQPELLAPLNVHYCSACHLVQLVDVVHPDALFRNYLYVSSTSPSFVAHFIAYADTLRQRFALGDSDLVVDIGSNDGVLLKPLQNAGVRVLGIDPAQNIAAETTAAGITTIPEYFTPQLAREVRATYGPARVITANNVFAHTDDIHAFVEAVGELLAPDGVFVFEVQYLGALLKNNLFDIVYHEHLNYYHLTPLVTYFARQGFTVFDVEQPAVHGGSLRVYVQRAGGDQLVATTVAQLCQREQIEALNDVATYTLFAEKVLANRRELQRIIHEARHAGKRIVGFGAPAKATTLLYTFGLGADDIDYIIDDAPLKQGRVMPGSHIPIVSSEYLYGVPNNTSMLGAAHGRPDYCLILAWNFADSIMQNHQRFIDEGGQWIIPVPEPRIV